MSDPTYLQLLPKEVLEMTFEKRINYRSWTDEDGVNILKINGSLIQLHTSAVISYTAAGDKTYVDVDRTEVLEILNKGTGEIEFRSGVLNLSVNFEGECEQSVKNGEMFYVVQKFDDCERKIILEWLKKIYA